MDSETMISDKEKDEFKALLSRAQTIAFFTGAGVSTDSGVADFQTIDDHWPFALSRNELTSIAYFDEDPLGFWEAFNYLFRGVPDLKPNSFHHAVAALEATGKEVIVLTQNADGLHQLAGSTMVGELHGNNTSMLCSSPPCATHLPMYFKQKEVPLCPVCGSNMRPDAVLFGEGPRLMGDAKDVAIQADLFIVAGTSLNVAPVNSLPKWREMIKPDEPMVWINRDVAPREFAFSLSLRGEISEAAAGINEFVTDSQMELPGL